MGNVLSLDREESCPSVELKGRQQNKHKKHVHMAHGSGYDPGCE